MTHVPSDGFQGSGATFIKYGALYLSFTVQVECLLMYRRFAFVGFEYFADPDDPTAGYITWMVDGKPSTRVGAGAFPADPEADGGTGISQRLIPVEPMSLILNLGISSTFLFLFVVSL